MRPRTSVLAFALCLLATTGSQATPPLPDAAELARLLDRFDVPGAAIATLSGCDIDAVVTAGVADIEAGAAVGPHTAFEAASLSKPVFAWLVLSLADDGLVDLDQPIADDFHYPRITDEARYARLTPRMVLMHRTGLPNWVDESTPFHERSTAIPFVDEPGAAHSYSGEAYQLLQAHVEARTGRSLQQLFHERLGSLMPHSTFEHPLPDTVAPSRGYASARTGAGSRGMKNLYARGMAASSLVTTAGDYAAFLSRVCHGRGLRAQTHADMLSPHSPLPPDAFGAPVAWGLGWMIVTLDDGTLVAHGGNNDEYRALAGFLREGGDGLVILTNGANGQALIDSLAPPPGGG